MVDNTKHVLVEASKKVSGSPIFIFLAIEIYSVNHKGIWTRAAAESGESPATLAPRALRHARIVRLGSDDIKDLKRAVETSLDLMSQASPVPGGPIKYMRCVPNVPSKHPSTFSVLASLAKGSESA